MKKRDHLLIGLAVLLFMSMACNLPGFSAGQPTLDIIAVQQKQLTIIAEMTQSSPDQATQTPQPTPQPGTLYTATPQGDIPVTGVTSQPLPNPTDTVEPTLSTAIPMVTVSVDTNCRYGPHIVYDYLGAVMVDEKTEIIGRHPNGGWLLVNNPDKVGQTCWITMQYAEVTGNLSDVPIAPLPVFYDWNGVWTFVEFQVVVDGNLSLVQNGRNVSGVVNLPGGNKATYSGTLSENGQVFSGSVTIDVSPEISFPIYFKMLENQNQFIGSDINAENFSPLHACGYRNSVGYPAGCPLP
jgi:hypothetical protein